MVVLPSSITSKSGGDLVTALLQTLVCERRQFILPDRADSGACCFAGGSQYGSTPKIASMPVRDQASTPSDTQATDHLMEQNANPVRLGKHRQVMGQLPPRRPA